MEIYKKHTIDRAFDNESEKSYWVIDGNLTIGYQSGKDAKAVISGQRPRWIPAKLNPKEVEIF